MTGLEPKNVIIDLIPKDMDTEEFAEELSDLVSVCREKFLDTVHFTIYNESDSMNMNQRENTKYQAEYLWNNHGSVIGPLRTEDMCHGSMPNNKIKFWDKYMCMK